MSKTLHHTLTFFVVCIALVITGCDQSEKSSQQIASTPIADNMYMNHSDSARYIGMNTCKQCHQSIYESFIQTGMGRSFDIASSKKTSASFKNNTIYDPYLNMHYTSYLSGDSMYITEFRSNGKDTVYKRKEQVNFIIGSGQHTNSHLQSVNGYINQMPMTYYTQKHTWDMPPGFENGVNTRFTRKIGLECMSCHNGYPDFIMGSENKYKSVPNGIDCERCHGPGSIHVHQKMSGNIIDTSKYIDYSIVNPSKLPIDLQFDICQRCHLQGNAVLKNDHSFFDFKPGMKLNDFMSVFLPKYKNADDEFIMASHADRLKQSACFIKSFENNTSRSALKPYKGALTCITCHNPHVSVKETNINTFNNACKNCHQPNAAGDHKKVLPPSNSCYTKDKNNPNCVNCHMPRSGSIDIPHVSVHDHYIRKPLTATDKKKIKEFIGLYAINDKAPDALTRAMAYLQHYEKFEQKPQYLDSASAILKADKNDEKNSHALIKLFFLQKNYRSIIQLIEKIGEQKCYTHVFIRKSYDNKDGWASYQIAEAYMNVDNTFNTYNYNKALKWLAKACQLANYNLEFKVKYGNTLAMLNMLEPAKQQFETVLKEHPKNISALTNLGYIYLTQGKEKEALSLYTKGLQFDPDYEPLLMNLAGFYAYKKDYSMAISYLKHILSKNPLNSKAKQAIKQLQLVNS